MQLSDFKILSDENIDPQLTSHLRGLGFDVKDVIEEGLWGSQDELLLQIAASEERVVLTLDSDFGTMIYRDKKLFIGIVYLRPGHFESAFHLVTIQSVLDAKLTLEPPFILVAEHLQNRIKIRLNNNILF